MLFSAAAVILTVMSKLDELRTKIVARTVRDAYELQLWSTPVKRDSHVFALRIAEEEYQQVELHAAEAGVTPAQWCRMAVRRALVRDSVTPPPHPE